jgi:Gpi18-like mannosyltransferase
VLSRALLILLTVALAIARHRSPLALWNVLDARWYVGIATHGYTWSLDGKPALAFFPLYPALIHLGIRIGIQAAAAGLLIANVSALAALFYVRALVAGQWGPSVGRRGVWLLALFPTAFFTFAPYTESLFLLAASAVLYHSQRGHSTVAGLWLAVGMLTRSTGVILLAPLLMSVLWGRRRGFIGAYAPVVCAVAAYIGYLVWQHLPLGQVIGSEQRWHRSLTYPWNGFTASLHYLAYHVTYNAGWTAENLLQVGVTVAFLGLTLAAWRSLVPPVVVYCAGFWAVVLCTPEWRDGYFAPFSSVDRFVLALFPLAGWIASRMAPGQFKLWLVVSGMLMTGAAAVHLSGGWIG